MKNSKSLWAVILSVAIFSAVAMYCHRIFGGTVRSVQPQPKTIIVDASKSPITVNTNYSSVKFESLGRKRVYSVGDEIDAGKADNLITVLLKLQAKPVNGRIIEETYKAFSAGKEVPRFSDDFGDGKCNWTISNQLSALNTVVAVPTKNIGNKFDFQYDYQSVDLGSGTKVAFKNIKPSSLPISKKIGLLTLTLEKAYYGNAKSPHRFSIREIDNTVQDKWFVIEYTLEGPPDNFQGIYEILPDGWHIDTTSPDPYWFYRDNVKVKGESGKEFIYAGNSWRDDLGKGSEVFAKETEHRTRLESRIAKVNREKASQMITNRAYLKAIKCNGKFRFYEFYEAGRLPKTFTWEATVYPELKHRERQRIIFKNIPVPPATK